MGTCSVVCPMGQTMCAGRCVTTSNDAANCGMCGRACAAGESCVMGACQLVCPMGQTNCSGRCVDTNNDPANCSMCGRACAAGQACVTGMCFDVVRGCGTGSDGDLIVTSSRTLVSGTYNFRTVNIAVGATLTLTGATATVIRAHAVQIDGTIQLSGAAGASSGSAQAPNGGAAATALAQAAARAECSGSKEPRASPSQAPFAPRAARVDLRRAAPLRALQAQRDAFA